VRILISGSSGLIGTAVADALARDGHTIQRLVRAGSKNEPRSGDVRWDSASGELNAAAAEGADAVVNLAGASIGEGRWTATRKELLRASRISSTRNLIRALGKLQKPPRVFLSASAVGYFGNRGDEELTEDSAAATTSWPRSAKTGKPKLPPLRTSARAQSARDTALCWRAMAALCRAW